VRRLDQILAWLIILFGVRSAAVSLREFAAGSPASPTAFFLLANALLLALCGMVNLLRVRYAVVAPGLRLAAAASNGTVAAFTVVAGVAGGEPAPALLVGLVLLGAGLLGVRPPAVKR
jgi:hypothetical protein